MIDGVSIVELYLCFGLLQMLLLWHCGKCRDLSLRSLTFLVGCGERRDFSFAVPRGDSGMAGG